MFNRPAPAAQRSTVHGRPESDPLKTFTGVRDYAREQAARSGKAHTPSGRKDDCRDYARTAAEAQGAAPFDPESSLHDRRLGTDYMLDRERLSLLELRLASQKGVLATATRQLAEVSPRPRSPRWITMGLLSTLALATPGLVVATRAMPEQGPLFGIALGIGALATAAIAAIGMLHPSDPEEPRAWEKPRGMALAAAACGVVAGVVGMAVFGIFSVGPAAVAVLQAAAVVAAGLQARAARTANRQYLERQPEWAAADQAMRQALLDLQDTNREIDRTRGQMKAFEEDLRVRDDAYRAAQLSAAMAGTSADEGFASGEDRAFADLWGKVQLTPSPEQTRALHRRANTIVTHRP